MEGIRRKLTQFTEWSSRTTQNLVISLACLWGGAILLLFLASWIPSAVTKGAIIRAQEAVLTAQADVSKASTRYESESKWPKPQYIEGLAGDLTLAEKWLSNNEWIDGVNTQVGAQKALALAEAGSWNPDKTLAWARLATDNAYQGKQLGAVVTEKLDSNAKLQSDARAKITETDTNLSNANQARTSAQTRLDQERGDFLTKYAVSMDEALQKAQISQTKGQQYLDTAKSMVPVAESDCKCGDPDTAMAGLLQAKMEIDKINVLANQVTTGLDLQKVAKADAGTKTAQAKSAVSNAWTTIQNVVNTRGYTLDKALAKANSFYIQANDQQRLAAITLASPIADEGGKLDYLLAYQSANGALELSGKVVTEVKYQTDTADEAQAKINQFPTLLTTVQTTVDQAGRDLSLLVAYHAQSTWADVANAVNSARNFIQQAQVHFANAQRLISLQYQQFVDALSEAGQALDNLGSAQTQANNLITRLVELEKLRLVVWPGAESSAVSAISSAGPTVSGYSGYSSRAVTELSNANGSLSSARDYASMLQWQNAIDSANTAYSQANNAASWAQSDYDSEMARQRAEEEAARQRAQEETQRIEQQQESQSQSDSYTSPDNSYQESSPSDDNSFDSPSSDDNSW